MNTDRNPALDRMRIFLTLLVVLHHSVLAYVRFGHFDVRNFLASTAPVVDAHRWVGFDILVLFDDSFFMAWMFLLSGVFVLPSLTRKGGRCFLKDRAWRLGVPFAFIVVGLMPLAYFPSFLLAGGTLDLGAFWERTLTTGPWPGGPAWFIWLLLGFDVLVVAGHRVAPGLEHRIASLSAGASRHPMRFLLLVLIASAIGYGAMALPFGPDRWLSAGPFAFQASRLLLYAVYFAAGIVAGAGGAGRGLLAADGPLARRWTVCVLAGLATFALLVLAQGLRLTIPGSLPEAAWVAVGEAAFVLACAAIGLGVTAVFLRFASGPANPLDHLRNDAYGIYLVHYVFVIWLQYSVVNADFSAPWKAGTVFARSFGLSWTLTRIVRRIPVIARIV
jgi:hypothetical protein